MTLRPPFASGAHRPHPPEDNPLALQQAIAAGEVSFVDSPCIRLNILRTVAIVGTILAIIGKPFFTKGAKI